jgi:hypothetical protein
VKKKFGILEREGRHEGHRENFRTRTDLVYVKHNIRKNRESIQKKIQ